jgi:hypothetical protein
VQCSLNSVRASLEKKNPAGAGSGRGVFFTANDLAALQIHFDDKSDICNKILLFEMMFPQILAKKLGNDRTITL